MAVQPAGVNSILYAAWIECADWSIEQHITVRATKRLQSIIFYLGNYTCFFKYVISSIKKSVVQTMQRKIGKLFIQIMVLATIGPELISSATECVT